MTKRLYRIREGKQIAGVCGGIAEYFAIDPTIVRLIWALIALAAGTGVLVYLVCAFVIPEKPTNYIDVE